MTSFLDKIKSNQDQDGMSKRVNNIDFDMPSPDKKTLDIAAKPSTTSLAIKPKPLPGANNEEE